MMDESQYCDPKEVALKSFFLGPQAENADWTTKCVNHIFKRWFDWRRSLFPDDGVAITSDDMNDEHYLARLKSFEFQVDRLMDLFESEMPKFSPRYIGHMFSEISLPAFFGHIITLLHNPNNVSGESSLIGVKIEHEAIAALIDLVGYDRTQAEGHFTSGGTVANFEAMIRARNRLYRWLAVGAGHAKKSGNKMSLIEAAHLGWGRYDELTAKMDAADYARFNLTEGNPYQVKNEIDAALDCDFQGPVVLVPYSKHYSWPKGAMVLGLGSESVWPVELTGEGRLSVDDLKKKIELAIAQDRPVAMVVSVAGTTELGEVDEVDLIQDLIDEYKKRGIHIWHHIDAAYGGYFRCLADDVKGVIRNSLDAFPRVDSITMDSHKLGYVPFSSGSILIKSRRDYMVNMQDAPYIQFSKERLDRGAFTLEGSRSAAGAVATWMTAKTTGFNPEGYGMVLARSFYSLQKLEAVLCREIPDIRIAPSRDTNILCFVVSKNGESLSKVNELSRKIYDKFSPTGEKRYYLSMTTLHKKAYGEYLKGYCKTWNCVDDEDRLVLLRICLMNPFFSSVNTKIDYAVDFSRELARVVKEGG